MVNLYAYLEDSNGNRAEIGDTIAMDLLVTGWLKEGTIEAFRSDEVLFEGGVVQPIVGIKSFKVTKRAAKCSSMNAF